MVSEEGSMVLLLWDYYVCPGRGDEGGSEAGFSKGHGKLPLFWKCISRESIRTSEPWTRSSTEQHSLQRKSVLLDLNQLLHHHSSYMGLRSCLCASWATVVVTEGPGKLSPVKVSVKLPPSLACGLLVCPVTFSSVSTLGTQLILWTAPCILLGSDYIFKYCPCGQCLDVRQLISCVMCGFSEQCQRG